MKFVKVFAGLVLVLGLAGGLIWQFWMKDQVDYAQIATAYGAKSVCSCRFVAGREMASCMNDFTADIGPVRFDEGENEIRANVYGLVSSTARFEEGLGCTLVDKS